MAPTKWGIVSAGKISNDFVCCLRSLPSEEHEVVAVAGRNFDNAKKFAELHHIPRVYGSYEELAKDANVEVAYIGSLNPDHYATTKLMFDHGKHVLCEKPLTTNLKHTKELIQIATQKKLFLMEAMWSRCLPAYEKLKAELDAGTVGDVRHVHVTFGIAVENVERVTKKALGGSMMLDVGIYCLGLVDYVYGGDLPEKVLAVGDVTAEGVDKASAVSMKYGGGRLATFATSGVVELANRAEIFGTRGTLRVVAPFWCPTKIETPSGTFEYPVPSTVSPCVYRNGGGLCYEATEVRHCLRAGLLESPKMPHAATERLAFLTSEIFKQLGVPYVDE